MDWKPKALALRKAGATIRGIANKLSVPKSTVGDFIKPFNAKWNTDTLSDARGCDITRDTDQLAILLFDLETAPHKGYFWGFYDQTIPTQFIEKPGHLLSFACKWLDNPTIAVRGLPDYGTFEKDKTDDRELVQELYQYINAADIIIAHNLNKFDDKIMRSRFLVHGMKPTNPYAKVDTLRIVKKEFNFGCNKLDYLARALGFGEKLPHTGAALWMDCLQGDMDAWKLMLEYNAKDVLLLEELYLRVRAWDRTAPNVSIRTENNVMKCVCCGCDELIIGDKKAYTGVSEFDTYVCANCGKVNRARKSNKTKEERDNILTNAR